VSAVSPQRQAAGSKRVSTRDEILEALSDSPDGLTLKEIAEFCTACEHDEQIVGTMIAILHRENVIHPGPERQDEATVWIFGKEPEEKHEAPISLAGADTPGSPTSEAARAIARMRQDSAVTRAHAVPSKKTAPLTIRAKIEAALRDHGPMRATDVAKHVDEKDIGNHCSSLSKRKILIPLGGRKRGTIYGLPGQTLKDVKAERQPREKGRAPATLSRPANGGGGAVTSAAGPAVAESSLSGLEKSNDLAVDHDKLVKREFPEAATRQHDNLYKAALLDLQERRGAAAEQLAKLDRAIEAMRALT